MRKRGVRRGCEVVVIVNEVDPTQAGASRKAASAAMGDIAWGLVRLSNRGCQ